MDTASHESSGAGLGQIFDFFPGEYFSRFSDVRLRPLGPTTGSLVETSAFLRVQREARSFSETVRGVVLELLPEVDGVLKIFQ